MIKLAKHILVWGLALLALSACATFESMPPGFLYETSLRGEQGYPGRAARVTAANALLEAGTVSHPGAALRAAFPNQDIKIRQWGLRYFNADWTRYQIVLDADIGSGKGRVKCREKSTDTPVGALTLPELLSRDGAELQRQLETLVTACVVYARDLT